MPYALFCERETNDISRTTNYEDGLFAHPAGHCHADTAHELIVAHCATIEFLRSLLIHSTGEERDGRFPDALNPAGCSIHCGSKDPATIPTAAASRPTSCGGQI